MKKAFTLVEIMISVAILGFGLVIIIQAYLGALRGINLSQNYVTAASFARDKLGELELSAYDKSGLRPGEEAKEEKIRLGLREFNWEQDVRELTLPEALAKDFVEACIKLNWQEQNILKNVGLAMYLPKRQEANNETAQE